MQSSYTYQWQQSQVDPGVQSRTQESQHVTKTQVIDSAQKYTTSASVDRYQVNENRKTVQGKTFESPGNFVQYTQVSDTKRYEELIQDNRRMREVIDQLRNEVQTLQTSGDTAMLSRNIQILQAELEAKDIELNNLRMQLSRQGESSSRIEEYMLEIDQWRSKYSKLEQGLPSSMNSLDFKMSQGNSEQVTHLESQIFKLQMELRTTKQEADQWKYKVRVAENDIKQNTHHSTQQYTVEISRLNQQIEVYISEIEQWQSRYNQTTRDLEVLREQMMRMESRSEIDRLNSLIQGYLHEIHSWKQRYNMLEARLNDTSHLSRYEVMISEYQRKISLLEQAITDQKSSFFSAEKNTKQAITQEYESRISQYEMERNSLYQEIENLKIQIERYKDQISTYEMNARSSEETELMARELDYYRTKVLEMQGDIEVLISELQGKQDVIKPLQYQQPDMNILISDYEMKMRKIENEWMQRYQALESRASIMQQTSGQDTQLRSEIERWKKRYMETEVRLKEFDELNLTLIDIQGSYRRLQSDYQSLQSDYQRLQDENQRFILEIKTVSEERDRVTGRMKQLEGTSNESSQLKIQWQQSQQKYESELSNMTQRLREVEAQLRDKQFEIDQLKKQLGEQGRLQEDMRIAIERQMQQKFESELQSRLTQERKQIEIRFTQQSQSKYESEINTINQRMREVETQLRDKQYEVEQLKKQLLEQGRAQEDLKITIERRLEGEFQSRLVQERKLIEGRYVKQLEGTSGETSQLKSQIQRYESEIMTINQRMIELEAQLRPKSQEIDQLKWQLAEQTRQQDEIRINIERQVQQRLESDFLNRLEKEKRLLMKQVEGTSTESAQLKMQWQQQQQKYDLEITSITSKMIEMEAQLRPKQLEIEQLRKQLAEQVRLQEDMRIAIERQTQQRLEVEFSSRLQQEKKVIEGRLNESSQLKMQFQQSQQKYDQEISKLSQQLREVEGQLRNKQYEIDAMKSEQGRQQEDIRFNIERQMQQKWEAELQTRQLQDKKKFEVEISTITSRVDGQLREKQYEIESLRKQLSEQVRQQEEMRQSIERQMLQKFEIDLQSRLAQERKQIESRFTQQSQQKYEIEITTITSRLETQLRDRQQEIDQLRRQLSDQVRQQEEMRITIEKQMKQQLEAEFTQRLIMEKRTIENRFNQDNTDKIKVGQLELIIEQLRQERDDIRMKFNESERRFMILQSDSSDKNRIRELEAIVQQLRSESSKVNVEEIRIKETRFGEVEKQFSQLKIDYQRLLNIREEQEKKIQNLISKVTEYESQINIQKQMIQNYEARLKDRQQSGSGGIQQDKIMVRQFEDVKITPSTAFAYDTGYALKNPLKYSQTTGEARGSRVFEVVTQGTLYNPSSVQQYSSTNLGKIGSPQQQYSRVTNTVVSNQQQQFTNTNLPPQTLSSQTYNFQQSSATQSQAKGFNTKVVKNNILSSNQMY